MAEYIFKISKDVKIEKGSGWMNNADARKKKSFLFKSCNSLLTVKFRNLSVQYQTLRKVFCI